MSTQQWSVPETELMATMRERLDDGEPTMLATVVDVKGNAYRRPGAKMIVSPDRGGVGAISAGCLEDEIRELARDVLADGTARVETFDLTGDDDVWGMGVGCNGVITVLLEPLDETMQPAVEAYEAGRDSTVATVVASTDDRVAVGDRAVGARANAFPADVADAVAGVDVERSRTVEVTSDRGAVTVFVDRVRAPADLVVLGTGHDVEPVVELASNVDFSVTVVGFRGATDTESRFAAADRVVTTSPRSLTDDIEFDADTYVVVMTHNFVDDRLSLDELLDTPTPYVGLMGPDDRFEEMVEAFAEEGQAFSTVERSRIYTPAGLELGGGAPYQVAHSIVAEALTVRNDRDGGHLRTTEGHVHARGDAVGNAAADES